MKTNTKAESILPVQPNTVATILKWHGKSCTGVVVCNNKSVALMFGSERVEYTPGMQQWVANIIADRMAAVA